jgi:transposase
MSFYCGIDLSARDSHVCVIDQQLIRLIDQKVKNDLQLISCLLEPYKADLQIVVESTFNWYWLVDGLRAAGFSVCLAHTLGLFMITGAKIKTDRRDAFALAKLLLAGVIPRAYIYPPETRPVRDLLRQRLLLVRRRAELYGRISRLLLREGILDASRHQIKELSESELEHYFGHPLRQLSVSQELARIHLYSEQITELEQAILARAQAQAAFAHLQQVYGIGPVLALTILYEVGEVSRFENVRHFCSYCRLVPGLAQSGSTTKRGRGSKQGNHYLKWAFSQAAVDAVRCYPQVRRCFERHVSRRRGRGRRAVAYGVIAHKLAQAVYYVLSEDTEFHEQWLFGQSCS